MISKEGTHVDVWEDVHRSFDYYKPQIDSISNSVSCAGDTVTVYGSGFCHNFGELRVYIDNQPIAAYHWTGSTSMGYLSHSFNHITFIAPPLTGGLYIKSQSYMNTEYSDTVSFDYYNAR